ncbi:MAG: orotidine-5'-phosphate decarboxylase [Planctomycetota bacterium]|nr:orotidine-5'-phosphate decarboxylase [Planctomycetota bacterium]
MIPFGQRLALAVSQKKNPVCVGIDPRAGSLPESLKPKSGASLESIVESIENFSLEIIDAVADLVPIVKPQSAFFEELGPLGLVALHRIVRYASQRGVLVVMDAKRGDIGTTAVAYANAYLGSGAPGTVAYSPWGADALTINPYLGADTLEPFTQRCASSGSGVFVLVKTSNPGSSFLQDQRLEDGRTVSETVADEVESLSFATRGALGYGDIGAVVGATYPRQLEAMRARMPSTWILIPGYGAQGGSAQDVKLGLDARGLGAIVNSSRGIIFAYEQSRYEASRWTESVRKATLEMIEALS